MVSDEKIDEEVDVRLVLTRSDSPWNVCANAWPDPSWPGRRARHWAGWVQMHRDRYRVERGAARPWIDYGGEA